MEISLKRFRSRSRSFESNLNRGQDTRARTGLDQAHNHTLICPFGKTHNHRSRGDTPWRGGADSTKHTQTETRGRGSQEVKGGDGSKPCARARSQPLPALTYRGQPAAFAPRSLSIHVGLARAEALYCHYSLLFREKRRFPPRPDTAPHQLATPLPSRRLRLLDVDSGVREGRHRHRSRPARSRHRNRTRCDDV